MQDEFCDYKTKLIDKETKKRMLEEVWQDRVVVDESEERKLDAEKEGKKSSLQVVKGENRDRRTRLAEQAAEIEREMEVVSEKAVELTAQCKTTEEAIAAAEAHRARDEQEEREIARKKEQLAETEAKIARTEGETARLNAELARLRTESTEEGHRS